MSEKQRWLAITFGMVLPLVSPLTLAKLLPNNEPCGFTEGLQISGETGTLFIADNPGFDPYRYILVDPISIAPHDEGPDTLTDVEQAQLRAVFKKAIEHEWQERFGWQSTDDVGADVIRLRVQINDINTVSPDSNPQLHLNVSLSDSLTGRQLMAQCNESLNLSTTTASTALAGIDDSVIQWHHLQQTVMHWGAGLGSFIMTAN